MAKKGLLVEFKEPTSYDPFVSGRGANSSSVRMKCRRAKEGGSVNIKEYRRD